MESQKLFEERERLPESPPKYSEPNDHSAITVNDSQPLTERPVFAYAYEFVHGKNRYPCGRRRCARICGCIPVTGPSSDNTSNICIWSFIIIPSVFFFVFAAPKLWDISPALPILCGVCCALTIILLLLTQFTDPGIIPRSTIPVMPSNSQHAQQNRPAVLPTSSSSDSMDSTHAYPLAAPPVVPEAPTAPYDDFQSHFAQNNSVLATYGLDAPQEELDEPVDDNNYNPPGANDNAGSNSTAPAQRTVVQLPSQLVHPVDGVDMTWRWCHTCCIYKPPRAAHCRYCGNCVKEFDHHCPFVGNCVGQRNYFFFLAFLALVMIYIVVIMMCTLFLLSNESSDNSSARLAALIVLGIIGGTVFILLCMLTGMHIYLMIIGKTTKELLGKKTDATGAQQDANPFLRFVHDDLVRGADGKVIEGRTYLINRPSSLLARKIKIG